MRAQQPFGVDIKRVLHITRRVVSRQIHAFKIIIIKFHLRPLGNSITHAQKDFLKIVHNLRQRVLAAQLNRPPGQSNIHFFFRQLGLQHFIRQLLLTTRQILLQRLAQFIYHLAGLGAFFWLQLAH